MQIIFTFETQYGPFTDALHLAEDHTFTDAEVEAMKQERLTNWILMLESPPMVEEPLPIEETPLVGEVLPVEETPLVEEI